MTSRQTYIMSKAQDKINELRSLLDDVMYRTDPLTPEELKKVREGYDLVCQANDKLF